jgi:hypothetical protein
MLAEVHRLEGMINQFTTVGGFLPCDLGMDFPRDGVDQGEELATS